MRSKKPRGPAHNRVEMIGKKFNSWLVLEVDGNRNKGKSLYYKAQCLECNEVYSVWGANLRSGASKRCSKCGCGHAHSLQKGQVRTKRTPEEAAVYYLYLKLKRDAKKRQLNWELSLQQTEQIIKSNCHYCGLRPSLVCRPLKHQGVSHKRSESATITRNGIDRRDPSKGYEASNVVPCCEQCNKAKLDYTEAEFIEWALRLAKHLKKNSIAS